MADVETAPKCKMCGKPARYSPPARFGASEWPGFYLDHCGSSECQHLLGARVERPAEQHERLCRSIGVQYEYQGAALRDFPGVELPPRQSSILIRGMNGRGKTRLACAILLDEARKGRKCHFTTATMFLKRVRSSYSKRASETEMDILDHLLSFDLLCLDDLGAEKQGDFGLSEILNLLSERSTRGLCNIVTTNLKLVDIHKIEPRLASRLAAYADVELAGEDKRVKG